LRASRRRARLRKSRKCRPSGTSRSVVTQPANGFSCEPDPENPGWLRWRLADPTRFNEAVLGRMIVRPEGADICRVRIWPQHHHTNNTGNVHGAVTLALIDIALFAAMKVLRDV